MSEINYEVLSELKEILADDFPMFIQTFIDDTKVRLRALEIALMNKDLEQLRQEAHSLKGSSSNLGVSELTDTCYELETQAHAEKFPGIEQRVLDVKVNADKVIAALEEFMS